MTQLFISHSSRNNAEAVALSDWLRSEGWEDLFLDIDPERGIVAGERWERALHRAVNRCEAVLFLISPDWLASEWCRREFTIARQTDRLVFVLLIGGTEEHQVPSYINDSWQHVNLFEGDDHGAAREVLLPGESAPRFVYFSNNALAQLRAGLKKAGLHPESFPWPPPNDPNRSPYRGMRHFEAEDAGIFFGREAPTIELLAQLRGLRDSAPPRFLAILGASGAGKSSFLRAGILPRLARDDRHFLPLPIIRPERAAITGSNGFLACLWLIRQQRELNWSRRSIEQAINSGAAELLPFFNELAQSRARQDCLKEPIEPPAIVLSIDQCEELFVAESGDEAKSLLSLLNAILKSDAPRLIVICTIRSDRYEELQSAPALSGISQRTFSLPPMPRGAYRQIIEAPLKSPLQDKRQLKIEPKLTEALLHDVAEGGGKDALPLLAFTLERLYRDYRQNNELTLSDYQDLGEIGGAIQSAVELALAEVMRDSRPPLTRDACLASLRRALVPWLAGIDPVTKDPYRKVARLQQLPVTSLPLIAKLVDYRLLAQDLDGDGQAVVEPSHEALLRQWPTLRSWLQEDRAALAVLESLKASSRDWQQHHEDPAWLTHSAGRLQDAEAIRSREDLDANLDTKDREYLKACRLQEDIERNKEIEAARSLARQRELTVIATRRALFVTALLLLVAISASVVAWRLQSASEANLRQAAERALGRAREQLEAGNEQDYLAYLAESLSIHPEVSQREAVLALQQQSSSPLEVLIPTSNLPVDVEFSPNGKLVAGTMMGGKVALWEADTGRKVGETLQQGSGVVWAQFSPDGTRLVTTGEDNNARLWSVATQRELGSPMSHLLPIKSVSFSPDGLLLATAGEDGVLALWNATTAVQVFKRDLGRGELTELSFSGDGRLLVVGEEGGTARLWDVATGMSVGDPMVHFARLTRTLFSPDGSKVLTASIDGTARLWDTETQTEIGDPRRHGDQVKYAEFSPDGTLMLTIGEDAVVVVWDTETGTRLEGPIRHGAAIHSARFSPDGRRILTSGADGTARLWNAYAGEEVFRPMNHEAAISIANFSPDGSRAVSASFDSSIRVWQLRDGRPVGTRTQFVEARSAREVGRGNLSDEAGNIPSIKLKRNRQTIATLGLAGVRYAFAADVLADGSQAVIGGADGLVRVLALPSGKTIGNPMQNNGAVVIAAFSHDGTKVVTSTFKGDTRLWAATTSVGIGELMQHQSAVNVAAFSPDDTRVVTASEDGSARIWDSVTGKRLGEPMRHQQGVRVARFSPDGEVIVTASGGGTARLWNGFTGAAIGDEMTHAGAVSDASFSADGKRLVTASDDKSARLWDGRSGVALGAQMVHDIGVVAAGFSRDNKKIVTVCRDNSVWMWDALESIDLGEKVNADQLIALADRSVTGDGKIRLLDGPHSQQTRKRLLNRVADNDSPLDDLVQWHFSGRPDRRVSPYSEISVSQHIEREIDRALGSGMNRESVDSNFQRMNLERAYNLDPSHPLILLALSVFESRPGTRAHQARLSFPRFEQDGRLAARAAEILLVANEHSNASKAAKIVLSLRTATESDRERAQSVLDALAQRHN